MSPIISTVISELKKKLNKNCCFLFSDQSKLIDLEEAAKAAEKGKWAKDASEVIIQCL